MAQKVNKFVKIIIIGCLIIGPFVFWIMPKYVVPIVMYHEVDTKCHYDKHEYPKGPNCVSPQIFEKHMAFLKRYNYNVLSFDQYISAKEKGEKLPWGSVVITFDDGYENNYTHAYPILRKYDLSAIIFVVSDFVNTNGYLTWDQLEEMMLSGIEVGGHSRTHAFLPKLNSLALKDELITSKDILESNLNAQINYLAYPFGGFNDEIKKITQEAGYKAACTTNRGKDRFNNDLYELKRVRLSNQDDQSVEIFWKLTGFYNLTRRLKNPS